MHEPLELVGMFGRGGRADIERVEIRQREGGSEHTFTVSQGGIQEAAGFIPGTPPELHAMGFLASAVFAAFGAASLIEDMAATKAADRQKKRRGR